MPRLQLLFQAEKVIYKKETIIIGNDGKLPPQQDFEYIHGFKMEKFIIIIHGEG